MHSFIPATKDDKLEMLSKIGVSKVDELFADIPDSLRLKRPLDIQPGLSELEVLTELKRLAAKNISADDKICFLGGGVYDHYIPAAIPQLISRQEFITAYTPYQAEISQGTLQSIFEFQTFMARLTGMDISNASVYDGATACAEAMFMAASFNGRNEIVVLSSVNQEYRDCCKTYARFRNLVIKEAVYDPKTGQCDLDALNALVSENTAAVIVQSPNYYGIIEELEKISGLVKTKGAVFIVACDPVSLGLLKPPGECGADIAVGEGQALGSPMSFGGPGFGFLCCKQDFLRKLPGRIVGETTDKEGRRGFVLTMQAREQHIRREKATSNICSNQALCVLAAGMYMSFMGKSGMKKIAELCFSKAKYLYDALVSTGRFEPVFTGTVFKEFTLRYKGCLQEFIDAMNTAGFLPGIALSDEGVENCLLIAATEKRTKEEIDCYVRKAGELK